MNKIAKYQRLFILIFLCISSSFYGDTLYDRSLNFEEILPEFDVKVNSFTVRGTLLGNTLVGRELPGFNDDDDEVRLSVLDENLNMVLSVIVTKSRDLYKVSFVRFNGKDDLSVIFTYDENHSAIFSLFEKGNLILISFKVTQNGNFIYSSEEAIFERNRLTLSVMERRNGQPESAD